MPKPILLAIDDDTSVLEAVVQDLRRHYGQDYRIVRAASGAAALDICRQLKERKDIVALFLSDQRMPGMTGVDFLQQALCIYPNAKRVRGIRQKRSSIRFWTICWGAGRRGTNLHSKEYVWSASAGRRWTMPSATFCRATEFLTSG